MNNGLIIKFAVISMPLVLFCIFIIINILKIKSDENLIQKSKKK